MLPIWLLAGQLLAGLALIPLMLTGSPGLTEDRLIVLTVIAGWAAVSVGTWLWLWRRDAWQHDWHAGHGHRHVRAVGIGVAGALAGFLVVQLIVGLFIWITGSEPPEQEVFELLDDPTIRFAVGAVAVLVAPFVEEIVFRGVVLDVMARRWSWHVASVAQAVVFSAIHIETLTAPSMFLALGLLGYIFAWLRRWTGSLVAPIAAHLVFNLVSVSLGTG